MLCNDSGKPLGHVVPYGRARTSHERMAAVLERTDQQLCMPELMAAKLAATAPNGGTARSLARPRWLAYDQRLPSCGAA